MAARSSSSSDGYGWLIPVAIILALIFAPMIVNSQGGSVENVAKESSATAVLEGRGFIADGKVNTVAVGEAIATVPITDRSATGYIRSNFGEAWADVDGNGCDTRNDMLIRDLVEPKIDTDGCTVLGGTLANPYKDNVIDFVRQNNALVELADGSRSVVPSNAVPDDAKVIKGGDSMGVQIDHIIPLSAAWTGGANGWDDATRIAFANDPENLTAVDGSSNGSKSDKLPGDWMPQNRNYHCTYVAQVTHILTKYGLAATQADIDKMNEVNLACAVSE